MKNLKKRLIKRLIKGIITGFIVGLAVWFVVIKFMEYVFNSEGHWTTLVVAIASAIGAIIIIELNKHSKEKDKKI